MHEYDTALKLLLRNSGKETMRALTGGLAIARWLDVELPEVRNTMVDLLGESTAGDLVHIELQSTNDRTMPLRMAEYFLKIYRIHGRKPRQIVLYVGEAPLRMETGMSVTGVSLPYETFDIRELDGERLLESADAGDNIIAVLANLRDSREAVRRIIGRIAELGPGERDIALTQLLILSGLRKLGEVVERESRNMPILNDIMDHEVLGREFKKGMAQGLEQGLERGKQEGERMVVRRLLAKRFGPLPAWAENQLASLPLSEIEELSERLLDAASLKDLLN